MPFGIRQICFRGSFEFSIVTILKLSSLWKPENYYFRHFSKLKISYLNRRKNLPISHKLHFTPNTSGCHGLMQVIFKRGKGDTHAQRFAKIFFFNVFDGLWTECGFISRLSYYFRTAVACNSCYGITVRFLSLARIFISGWSHLRGHFLALISLLVPLKRTFLRLLASKWSSS